MMPSVSCSGPDAAILQRLVEEMRKREPGREERGTRGSLEGVEASRQTLIGPSESLASEFCERKRSVEVEEAVPASLDELAVTQRARLAGCEHSRHAGSISATDERQGCWKI